MNLTNSELEFLAAWAREEWEPACYQLPAHRLQLAHAVPGAYLIAFIKAWTRAEGTKDQDILNVAFNPEPGWPWASEEDFRNRLGQAQIAVLPKGFFEKIRIDDSAPDQRRMPSAPNLD